MSAARTHVCMVVYTDYVFDARVRREAETLAAHGFHVRCLSLRMPSQPKRFNLNGVEVDTLPIAKYRGKSTAAYVASYVRFLALATARCARLLIRGELDIFHAHNLPDFLVFAGLIPRLAGKRVVLDIHDSVPETFATKFEGGALSWSLLCLEERVSAAVAHHVICVNHPQRDTLVSRGLSKAKTFVSMNVPDPRIFVPVPADAPREHAGFLNLVYHGTMAERLGVDLVIRAVARLRDRIPQLRLHLWGHGDDLALFQRLAGELGIEDSVLFRPKGYPLQELSARLHSMDIGVVGNRRSVAGDLMLPVKLLEYVALGIPAVVPRLKTIEHYFSAEMVEYFSPEDVDSLAEAIAALALDPDRRRRRAGLARTFLADYGWDRQGAELVSLYQSLAPRANAKQRKQGEVNA